MKKIVAVLLFSILGKSLLLSQNFEKQSTQGFVDLFNGKDLSNWHSYGASKAGSAWKVVNGEIYLDTTHKVGWQIEGGGDLVCNETFTNFHLVLEWKISPKGNSGILFMVQDEPNTYKHAWYTGPEMQILDNSYYTSEDDKHKAGALYDLYSATTDAVKPAGQWNIAEIIVKNPVITLKLNGIPTVNCNMSSEDFKTKLAQSKFKNDKEIHGFLENLTGHIALQDHGSAVYYRNIKIKRLN